MNKLPAILALCVTAIICTVLLAGAYKSRNNKVENIYVTGLGKKDFVSDLIVWNGSFSRKYMQMPDAYAALNKDREAILNYLVGKGISSDKIVFSAVDIDKDFKYNYDDKGNSTSVFTGFRLTQSVKIESNEVNKVETISREVTELINQGIEFYSQAPRYYYTKLSDLKIEMIAEATQDATERANKIAENAGASLGNLKSARMGVFQIVGQNSNEDFSWGGSYNTSSKNKTANITMKLTFGIE